MTASAHLVGSSGSTGLVLVEHPDRLPTVAWFGVVPAGLDAADVVAIAPAEVPLLPEAAHGWYGKPGLLGHREDGQPAAWSTWFLPTATTVTDSTYELTAVDEVAGLELRTEIVAAEGRTLRVRHSVTNVGAGPYLLDSLDVTLPVPDRAAEALDLTGRWGGERQPQRHPVRDGIWLRENRRGKTGFDSPTVLHVGVPGFRFAEGELWAAHVAWSGNSAYRLERSAGHKATATVTTVGGGELLLPGEAVLGTGETYTSPWVHFAASAAGLDGVAEVFHRQVRSFPAHPSMPRPVTLNVWEAVVFDQDADVIAALARQAAAAGVERFVLDDGWFGGRRNDRAGLGDWTVSPEVWPHGLGPLIDEVHALGMQFGLWFEPEMVNPDSDLFRAHPDWILGTAGRVPPEERHQQVLDLGQPGAFAHVLDQLSAVLDAYDIDYVKWDHNRDFIEPGSAVVDHRPGVRVQALRFYALLDELRRRFPRVEWESCASGGGRIDLEVAHRVERFWTSDQNDALSRLPIHRWTTQLVPPEYLGAHIFSPRSHATGRTLSLELRAAAAFFGHLGVEWDLTRATDDERLELAVWIAAHKRHRALLHTGRVFRVDTGRDDFWVHGVVSPDRLEAVVAAIQLDDLGHSAPPIRVPGLVADRRYEVRRIGPEAAPLLVSGAALAEVGLPAPALAAQSAVLLHLAAAGR